MFVMPGEGLFAVGITSINGYLFNALNGNSADWMVVLIYF